MARDPGRYLVIEGDQLKRTPTVKMNVQEWMFDDMNMTGNDDDYSEKHLVAPDDYICSTSTGASYPGYVNENAFPPPFEKPDCAPGHTTDNLHSPLRYTSSPTLGGQAGFPTDKLTVDTEDYLEPVSVRGSQSTPAVDDDGYLHPQSASGYIDVLSPDEKSTVPALKRQSYSSSSDGEEDEASREPLLGAAENSVYLRTGSTAKPSHNPTTSKKPSKHKNDKQLPNGTNPIYMSNNNGSPVAKQAPVSAHDYNNIDYVNQSRFNPV